MGERYPRPAADEVRDLESLLILANQPAYTRKSLADLVRDLVYPYAAKSLLDENSHRFAEQQAYDEIIETQLLRTKKSGLDFQEQLQEEMSKLERAKAGDVSFDFVEAQSLDAEELDVEIAKVMKRCYDMQALQEGRKPEEVFADEISALSESVEELSHSLEQLAEIEQALLTLVERRGVDDQAAIERKICENITENELTDLFSVGRAAGRIYADCHRMEWWWLFFMDVRGKEWEGAIGGVRDEALSRNVVEWHLSHPQHFWDKYEAGLRELAAVPRFKSLTYAPLVIERELRRLPTDRIRFGFERMGLAGELEVAGLARLAQIRVLIGMTVGELVSSVQEDDAASLPVTVPVTTPLMIEVPAVGPAGGQFLPACTERN